MTGGAANDTNQSYKKKHRVFCGGVPPLRCPACLVTRDGFCDLFFSTVLLCADALLGVLGTETDFGQQTLLANAVDCRVSAFGIHFTDLSI